MRDCRAEESVSVSIWWKYDWENSKFYTVLPPLVQLWCWWIKVLHSITSSGTALMLVNQSSTQYYLLWYSSDVGESKFYTVLPPLVQLWCWWIKVTHSSITSSGTALMLVNQSSTQYYLLWYGPDVGESKLYTVLPPLVQPWCWWIPSWTRQTLAWRRISEPTWHSQRRCPPHQALSPYQTPAAAETYMHTSLGVISKIVHNSILYTSNRVHTVV